MYANSRGGGFELVFWLVVAALGFYFSLEFDRKIEFYRFGAATWPRMILLLIVVAAIVQWWTGRRTQHQSTSEEQGITATASEHEGGYGLRLTLTFGLPLAYAALWDKTGFYFTTPLFLIAYLYVTGERRIKWLIGVPLMVCGVLTFIFTRLLYVGLPVGYWEPFYTFSNWLVTLIRG